MCDRTRSQSTAAFLLILAILLLVPVWAAAVQGGARPAPTYAAASEPSTITVQSGVATLTATRTTLVTAVIEPAHANMRDVYLLSSINASTWRRVGRMYYSPRLRKYYLTVRPTSLRFYRAVWYGDAGHRGAVSSAIRIDVWPRLRFAPSDSSPYWGQRVTLAGSVYPNHYRHRVIIQIRIGGEWRTLYSLRLNRASEFSATYKPRLKGTYYFRAYLPKPDWDHLSNMTGPRTVRVTQGPVDPEGRALWVTRWQYKTAADIRRIMRNASEANLNTVYLQVRGQADAYYRSHREPWAARLTATSTRPRGYLGKDPGWDPLAVAIQQAHAHGLKLHAWINVYPIWMGTSVPATSYPTTSGAATITPAHIYYKGSAWRVTTRYKRNGRWYYPAQRLNSGYLWASPGNPDVADHIYRVALDIVSNYDVDGLHLDRVRYPGPGYSWDAASRAGYAADNAAYKASHGGRSLPRSVWQRAQINALVRRIYRGTKEVNPNVQVSAAVWGVYVNRWRWPGVSEGFYDYYQDSIVWARSGVVDALVPMTYYTMRRVPRWGTVVEDFAARRNGRQLYPGIAAYMFKNNWSELERQVRAGRTLGAQGVAFFDYAALSRKWVRLSGLFPLMVDPPVRGTTTALSLESTTTTPAEDETISAMGTLLPLMAGKTVYLRMFDTDHWDLVGSDTTDAGSRYSIPFDPPGVGTYRLRAIFKGDSTYAGTASRELVITSH